MSEKSILSYECFLRLPNSTAVDAPPGEATLMSQRGRPKLCGKQKCYEKIISFKIFSTLSPLKVILALKRPLILTPHTSVNNNWLLS